MSSGTVLAMSSTLAAAAAVVLVAGLALSVFFVQPDTISAPVAAKTAATRHIFPPDTSCLISLHRASLSGPSTGTLDRVIRRHGR